MFMFLLPFLGQSLTFLASFILFSDSHLFCIFLQELRKSPLLTAFCKPKLGQQERTAILKCLCRLWFNLPQDSAILHSYDIISIYSWSKCRLLLPWEPVDAQLAGKTLFLDVSVRCFRKRSELIDWVKKITLINVGGYHPIHQRLELTKRQSKG